MKEVRLRTPKPYCSRTNGNTVEKPRKKFFLVVEGSRTEIDYFNGIFNQRVELGINSLVDIIVLERSVENKTDSHPNHILAGILNKLNTEADRIDYQKNIDEIWLVFDRDPASLSENQFNTIYKVCTENGFNIGFTNPNFEFWLLLHLPNIEQYNNEDLFNNKKVNKKRRFIELELSKRLIHGYSKKKIKINEFLPGLDLAIKQEKLFANEVLQIVTALGSNIGTLITKMKNS